MKLQLKCIISSSQVGGVTTGELRQFGHSMCNRNIINGLNDKKSNVPFGLMKIIGFRVNMKLTVIPCEGTSVEKASEEACCDEDLGQIKTFAITIDYVPGVPLQTSVLRQVLQKRENAVIMNDGVKEVVAEGRTRLLLSGPTAPRTVMIQINATTVAEVLRQQPPSIRRAVNLVTMQQQPTTDHDDSRKNYRQ